MATPAVLVKMRVINRPRYIGGGVLKKVGDIIVLTPTAAKEWAYSRWAEYVKEEPPKAAPDPPAAPKKEEPVRNRKE